MLEAALFFYFSESWPLTFGFLPFVFQFLLDPDPNPDPERKYVNVEFPKIIFTTMCPVVGYRYTSVADPGCLSRTLDPDFYPSRIPDPKTATKEKNLL
jgi:hypothetical protein